MDWLFETQSGPDLSDTIGSGLARQDQGADSSDSLLAALAQQDADQDDRGFGAGNYDTMITTPMDPDPSDPPSDPPLDPPTYPEPLTPTGPIFDYSTLLSVPDLIAWLEWLGDTGPTYTGGGGGYDSLAEYLNGEWRFDVDPELIDTGGFYGDHDEGGYVNFGQFGTTNGIVGLPGPNGTLIPIFREWTEVVETPAGQGENISGFTVIHHTDFLGFQRSNTYEVASLTGIQDWAGRAEGVMNVSDILEAYQQLLAGAQGQPNTVAIGEPFISQANGMLMAAVTLDGKFIGHVQVGDGGYRLFDLNGNVVDSDLPLTQNWNETQGIIYWEQMAHQERTMSIPFAQGLVGLATIVSGGSMSFFTGLGFGLAAGVANGGSAANAIATARLLEAAYELRLIELRARNGN